MKKKDIVRNCPIECTNCGYIAPELEWDEVWSHTQGGFVATCCPKCRAVGVARYTVGVAMCNGQVVLYDIERLLYTKAQKEAKSDISNTLKPPMHVLV